MHILLGNYFPIFSKQVSKNLGPLWQPGVYNDTNTKPIHAGKNYWGIIFCANTCGACIRTRADNIFDEVFPEYFAKFLGDFKRWEYMPPCIRTRANSSPGKYSWRIIYVLVSCQGVLCVVNLLSHTDLLWRPPLRRHHFPGFCRHFSPQRGVQSVVNMGGIVKTLRRSNSLARSIFSTAGSFGH